MSTMLSYHQTGIIIPSAGKHNMNKKNASTTRGSALASSVMDITRVLDLYSVTRSHLGWRRLTIFWGRSRNPGNPLKKNFFWYWNPGLVDPTTWEELLKLNEFFLCMTNWFHWWNDFWKWWNPKLAIRYEIESQSHKIAGRPGFRGYLIVK